MVESPSATPLAYVMTVPSLWVKPSRQAQVVESTVHQTIWT